MYRIRTPHYSKRDPEMRWSLPDRVFFACGACHILAYAFLEAHGAAERTVWWLKPHEGFTGHHVVVEGSGWIFDYHGYSRPEPYWSHTWRRARRWWPGWDASLVHLPPEVLISEAASRAFDAALWLREPSQFLHDALPRARKFLQRFPVPSA